MSKSARPHSKSNMALTPAEFSTIQEAYDHFNRELFDGELPHVVITYRKHGRSHGFFCRERFSERNGRKNQTCGTGSLPR
jgi:hypothetical protein